MSTPFALEFPPPYSPPMHYASASSPCQVVEEARQPLSKYYRHISKGAWPFSTRDHGWPISDCSSEGLKAALALAAMPHDKVDGWMACPSEGVERAGR